MNKNKYVLKVGLLAAVLAVSGMASATTYYVADCQTGATAKCVAGNDNNPGTSAAAPWRTTAKVQAQFAGLKAGDQVLFARGGAWTNAGMSRLQSLNATAANPVVMDAYAPSWGGSARPLLQESRAGVNLIEFDNGGAAVPDGGYVVRNLDLRGNSSAQWGIFLSGGVSDVTFSDLNIEGFVIGVHCGEAIQRVKLQNSTLTNNSSQGALWGCVNSTIEGNTFDHNGYVDQSGRDHSVYLGLGTATPGKNVVVRNNRLTNNSVAPSGGICIGAPLVIHGNWDGVTIENNVIYQAPGTANAGCWGIAVDTGYGEPERFANVAIRANSIINVGGIGIGCSACVSPVIENNVIVSEQVGEMVGIQIPDRARGGDDAADTGAIVRNNTIYFKSSTTYAIGISMAPTDGSDPGSNLQVVSNLIYFGATSDTNHSCFALSGTARGNFTQFDNNLCFDASGTGRYSDTLVNLIAAKAAGFDPHGLAANPAFAAAPSSANSYALALSSTSPAINAGNATYSATTDRLGVTRSAPDIGAFEYTGGIVIKDTTPPSPPRNAAVK